MTGGTHSHASCQYRIVDINLQRNSSWMNEVRHREDTILLRIPQ